MEKKLKVLFVASGNSANFEIAPFIKAQGVSLIKAGIDISYLPIHGKGIVGYLKGASKLRKHLKEKKVDIIHAHYTLAGWTVVLALAGTPVVLSLMGDDAYGTYISPGKVKKSSYFLIILTMIIQPFVSRIISKSDYINSFVYRKKIAAVIPNGILLDKFMLLSKKETSEVLKLNINKKYILFLGDPNNVRKNFALIEKANLIISSNDVEILTPYPVSHEKVVQYLNAADVFVMPAFMEGSPNVIKEAMACNCPIVSTRVGDVEWVIGDTEGCYLADFDPADFAEKIRLALKFAEEKGRTNGRERIIKLGLDSGSIAKRIIEVYNNALSK
jgi:teichuronic acid biosynthesis glycosyltransferase TuaC